MAPAADKAGEAHDLACQKTYSGMEWVVLSRAYFVGRAYIRPNPKNQARAYFGARTYFQGNTVIDQQLFKNNGVFSQSYIRGLRGKGQLPDLGKTTVLKNCKWMACLYLRALLQI